MRLLISAAALTAAFCSSAPFAAMAEDVTLRSRSGGVSVTGTLLSHDGESYRVETDWGTLTVEAEAVDCLGPGCPVLGRLGAEITLAVEPWLVDLLLLPRLTAYAEAEGLQISYIEAEKRVELLREGHSELRLILKTPEMAAEALLAEGEADAALTSEAGSDGRLVARLPLSLVSGPEAPPGHLLLTAFAATFGPAANWAALGAEDRPLVWHGLSHGPSLDLAAEQAFGLARKDDAPRDVGPGDVGPKDLGPKGAAAQELPAKPLAEGIRSRHITTGAALPPPAPEPTAAPLQSAPSSPQPAAPPSPDLKASKASRSGVPASPIEIAAAPQGQPNPPAADLAALAAGLRRDPFGLALVPRARKDGLVERALSGACGFAIDRSDLALASGDDPLSLTLYWREAGPRLPAAARRLARHLVTMAPAADRTAQLSLQPIPLAAMAPRLFNAGIDPNPALSAETRRAALLELAAARRLPHTFRLGPDGQLDPSSRAALSDLAARLDAGIARGQELLLVGFAAGGPPGDDGLPRSRQLAERIDSDLRAALPEAEAQAIRPLPLGAALPLVCAEDPQAQSRNTRVEVWLRPIVPTP